MNIKHGCATIVLLIFGASAGTATADTVFYDYCGELPTGASSHSQIADGETFLASFSIDDTDVDTISSPDLGGYSNAVLSAMIEFSGGYSAQLDLTFMQISVFNSSAIEGIQIVGGPDFNVAVFNDSTNLLSSDALPGPGLVLSSNNSLFTSNQLYFADGGGSVLYSADDIENVVFKSSVPEPGSSGLLLFIGLLVRCRSRR